MMMEWLPIETAPKDGTWVLVHTGEYTHPISAFWFKYNGLAYWRDYNLDVVDEITHWMPLPKPPVTP
jgi:Protein of unknown function (DUF551).